MSDVYGKDSQYGSLSEVYASAMVQASSGKGKERHVMSEDEKFEDQLICVLRRYKLSFPAGQAVKKIIEARRLEDLIGKEAAIEELKGALNYTAAEIIVLKEESNEADQTGDASKL